MLEVDQSVKLQFELNDTLQTVDVLRGELTEVGNRLETIEGSHATPPSLEEWGGDPKPTSQVETFEGEPHWRNPERTCRSDLEDVEAALQRLPFQAHRVPHTSTEARTGVSSQNSFSGAVPHSTAISSHERYLTGDPAGVNSSWLRGEQPSNLTRSTVLYDPSPPPRRQESRPWDSGGSYRPQPLPRTRVREAQGPPLYREQPPLPPPRMRRDALIHPECSRSELSDDDSDGPAPIPESGLRTRQLESLAKDIERFDPDNAESNIDDDLREVERCLLDLYCPSAREKLKLIWKTTSRFSWRA
ncbi:hypothetical protein XENOCAPTIV_017876 [Xenoophorus captivus]|uniref:Uncharacterized protein n=1 Tax=Xenoophorus captivus TaxID=1517983 RepID=A0ABV0SFW6_9TELE